MDLTATDQIEIGGWLQEEIEGLQTHLFMLTAPQREIDELASKLKEYSEDAVVEGWIRSCGRGRNENKRRDSN